jgi:hypothetical protein
MKTSIKIIIVACIAAIIIIPRRISNNNITVPESDPTAAATSAERIDYFASHGWEVEEICCRNVTVPSEFSEIYEEYAVIQDKQGLPLREYAGKNALLYMYEVKNYSPDNQKMLAELLVCDDIAVASMVYSEDGGSIRMAVS